jgi:hypothetical protein
VLLGERRSLLGHARANVRRHCFAVDDHFFFRGA